MWANDPEMAKKWEKEEAMKEQKLTELSKKHFMDMVEAEIESLKGQMAFAKDAIRQKDIEKWEKKEYAQVWKDAQQRLKEKMRHYKKLEKLPEGKLDEKAKRDYKAEYKKYGSSKKAKKYRAELNAYNRKRGTYGNGDKKDASHKGGKIAGFEAESKNRGRREKSRLKKENKYAIMKSDLMRIVKEEYKSVLKEDWKSDRPGYSSKEAKTIMDKSMKDYAKILRKAQYQIIKDWMAKAKAGALDYFDISRGVNSGDVTRAYPYEVEFLADILHKDKIIDRFRKYFKGKKSLPARGGR